MPRGSRLGRLSKFTLEMVMRAVKEGLGPDHSVITKKRFLERYFTLRLDRVTMFRTFIRYTAPWGYTYSLWEARVRRSEDVSGGHKTYVFIREEKELEIYEKFRRGEISLTDLILSTDPVAPVLAGPAKDNFVKYWKMVRDGKYNELRIVLRFDRHDVGGVRLRGRGPAVVLSKEAVYATSTMKLSSPNPILLDLRDGKPVALPLAKDNVVGYVMDADVVADGEVIGKAQLVYAPGALLIQNYLDENMDVGLLDLVEASARAAEEDPLKFVNQERARELGKLILEYGSGQGSPV